MDTPNTDTARAAEVSRRDFLKTGAAGVLTSAGITATTQRVILGDTAADLSLPADSVTTLAWT